MAFNYFDRVKETSATTGTGNVSLGGATSGFRAFSSVYNNGDTFNYCIQDQSGSNWEVGTGTYNTSGNTISRTTVLASSNSGALVNFTSGALYVFVDVPASVIASLVALFNNVSYGLINGLGDSITAQSYYTPSGQTNAPAWATSHAYPAGQYAYANGNLYRSGGGTSASSGSGPTGTSPATDGTITWTYVSPQSTLNSTSFLKWAQSFSLGRLNFDLTQGYGGCYGGILKGFVINGGSNYSGGDTLNLPNGATGTLTIVGGVITGVTITNPGYPNGAVVGTYSITTSTGSGAILSFVANPSGTFATTGNWTQDMVAMLPDCIASNAGIITVHGGHNDVANNVAYATIIANLSTCYTNLVQAQKKVIAIPILPSTGFNNNQIGLMHRVNRWIRAFCKGETWANPNKIEGIALADATGYWTDGTSLTDSPIGGSGGVSGAMTQDGIHPSPRGAMYIGQAVWEAAQQFVAPAPAYTARTYTLSDGYSISYNPGGNMLEGINWTASTAYAVSDKVNHAGNTYYCTAGGTSAGSGGPTGTGGSITDGSVTWAYTGIPAGASVSFGTSGTLTAESGITYLTGSQLMSGWATLRLQGSASGTIGASIESPWSNGQNGQRQVLNFSLGSGNSDELWELYLYGNGNNAIWGIQAGDLGVTAVSAEAEVELSNLANFNGIWIEYLDANNIGMAIDGQTTPGVGYHQIQSSGEMIPLPNNGKIFLKTPSIVLPRNSSLPILCLRAMFDASGGAGSATATMKINYLGFKRSNVA